MNTLLTTHAWQTAGWTMLHFLWIGTLVAVLGGGLRAALRRAHPQVRYLASLAALALFAAAPLVIAPWIYQHAEPEVTNAIVAPSSVVEETTDAPIVEPMAPDVIAQAETPLVIDLAETPIIDAAPLETHEQASTTVETSELESKTHGFGTKPANAELAARASQLATLLPWLWIVGAPLTFALLALGLIGAERLRRAAEPASEAVRDVCDRLRQQLGVTRQVAVAIGDSLVQPVLIGIVRPLILLPPAALTGWSPEELEMVLLHELAHVRRWDNLVNLAQRLVESALFFHPCVWLLSRQVRHDREECVDAAVVARTARPQAYAELLLTIAAAKCELPPALVASALARHPLAGRIRKILKLEEEPMLVSRNAVAFVGLACLALVGALLWQPAAESIAQQENSVEVAELKKDNAENAEVAESKEENAEKETEEEITKDTTITKKVAHASGLSSETAQQYSTTSYVYNNISEFKRLRAAGKAVKLQSLNDGGYKLAASGEEKVETLSDEQAWGHFLKLIFKAQPPEYPALTRKYEVPWILIREDPAWLEDSVALFKSQGVPLQCKMSLDGKTVELKAPQAAQWFFEEVILQAGLTHVFNADLPAPALATEMGISDSEPLRRMMQSMVAIAEPEQEETTKDTTSTKAWRSISLSDGHIDPNHAQSIVVQLRSQGFRAKLEEDAESESGSKLLRVELPQSAKLVFESITVGHPPMVQKTVRVIDPTTGLRLVAGESYSDLTESFANRITHEFAHRDETAQLTENGGWTLERTPEVKEQAESSNNSVTFPADTPTSEIEAYINKNSAEYVLYEKSNADGTMTVNRVKKKPAASPATNSPFPTLEEQRAADLVYKLLGVEVEKLTEEELARVKAKKFAGGLRLETEDNFVHGLQSGDLLVGLHVWPTPSLDALQKILERDDLDELSPLKFYVIRKPVGLGGRADQDELVTGRTSVRLDAWREHLQRKQARAAQAEQPKAKANKQPSGAFAAAQVVETSPQQGAQDVEPGVRLVKVTFDRAMTDGSWSWATSEQGEFPETVGPPRFNGGKVAWLKVNLKPNTKYAIWINDEKHKNFKDITGRPSTPFLLQFKTGDASPNEPPPSSKATTPTYLYAGQPFEHWRDLWKYELSDERRIEAIKALAAFSRAGKGKEAAEAILDVAGEYDFRVIDSGSEGDLKEQVLDSLTVAKGAYVSEELWLPMLLNRYVKEPEKWQSLAASLFSKLPNKKAQIRSRLFELARDSKTPFSVFAFKNLMSRGAYSWVPPRNPDSNRVTSQGRITPEVRDPEIKQLIVDWLDSDNPQRVKTALEQMILDVGSGYKAGALYLPEMKAALFHEDESVRRTARKTLSMLPDEYAKQAVADLLSVLEKADLDPAQRVEAIRALAALGNRAEAAREELESLLENSESKEVQVAASVALFTQSDEKDKGAIENMQNRLLLRAAASGVQVNSDSDKEKALDQINKELQAEYGKIVPQTK